MNEPSKPFICTVEYEDFSVSVEAYLRHEGFKLIESIHGKGKNKVALRTEKTIEALTSAQEKGMTHQMYIAPYLSAGETKSMYKEEVQEAIQHQEAIGQVG